MSQYLQRLVNRISGDASWGESSGSPLAPFVRSLPGTTDVAADDMFEAAGRWDSGSIPVSDLGADALVRERDAREEDPPAAEVPATRLTPESSSPLADVRVAEHATRPREPDSSIPTGWHASPRTEAPAIEKPDPDPGLLQPTLKSERPEGGVGPEVTARSGLSSGGGPVGRGRSSTASAGR